MILIKFWSALLFYSMISIIAIILIWERNIILSLQNSSNFYFYVIGFIFLFPIVDDFFERTTSTPEGTEEINKKYNLALTKGLIFTVIVLLTMFGHFGWLEIGGIGSRLMMISLVISWWLLKIQKLWSNYTAFKSNKASSIQ